MVHTAQAGFVPQLQLLEEKASPISPTWGFRGGSVLQNLPANAEDMGPIPGSGRSPGEGNGNPLPVFFLENPMDRGAWAATVHGVTKNWTQLSNSTATTKIKLGKHIYF